MNGLNKVLLRNVTGAKANLENIKGILNIVRIEGKRHVGFQKEIQVVNLPEKVLLNRADSTVVEKSDLRNIHAYVRGNINSVDVYQVGNRDEEDLVPTPTAKRQTLEENII